MTNVVSINQGDSIKITVPVEFKTPLGEITAVTHNFTYDQLIAKLADPTKKNKTRRSKTEGAKVSRQIALYTNAITTGKWCTGAEINKSIVTTKLMNILYGISPKEFSNITLPAYDSLRGLLGKRLLHGDGADYENLEDVVDEIKAAKGL